MIFEDFVIPNLPEVYRLTQGDKGEVEETYSYGVFAQGINEFPIPQSGWADGSKLTARATIEVNGTFSVVEQDFVLTSGEWVEEGDRRSISEYEFDSEIEITENGNYDVSDYVTADVNVSGGGGGVTGKVTFVNNAGTDPYLKYIDGSGVCRHEHIPTRGAEFTVPTYTAYTIPKAYAFFEFDNPIGAGGTVFVAGTNTKITPFMVDVNGTYMMAGILVEGTEDTNANVIMR